MRGSWWFALAVVAACVQLVAGMEREYMVGPFEFQPTGEELNTFQVVEKPAVGDNMMMTSWRVQVVDENGEDSVARDGLYFHHSVLHEWIREETPVVHNSQMLFLASPDVVSQEVAMEFPAGYGIAWNSSDVSEWALCCHAVNKGSAATSLWIRMTVTFEERTASDRLLTAHFLGKKLRSGDLSDGMLTRSSQRGFIAPGHGAAELVVLQWHLHSGVVQSELRNGGAPVSSVLSRGDITNGIEVYPLEYYSHVRFLQDQPVFLDSVVEVARIHEDISDGDLLMVYALMYVSYEDNWCHHGGMVYMNNISQL